MLNFPHIFIFYFVPFPYFNIKSFTFIIQPEKLEVLCRARCLRSSRTPLAHCTDSSGVHWGPQSTDSHYHYHYNHHYHYTDSSTEDHSQLTDSYRSTEPYWHFTWFVVKWLSSCDLWHATCDSPHVTLCHWEWHWYAIIDKSVCQMLRVKVIFLWLKSKMLNV